MARPDVEAAFRRYQRTGAPDALGEVFDGAAGELFRVASHLAPDLHAAEDLVQATFLVAIERRDDYRPTGAGVLAWLLGILANRARRLRAAPPVDARQLGERLAQRRGGDGAAIDAATAASHREVDDAVSRALERLPETYRVVLRMHLRHGLPAGEIALLLERPPGTVRTQLVRGIELLRRALPAGLAVGAAALATPLRGLAAMRQAIVARAIELAPTAAAAAAGTGAAKLAAWSLLGGIVVNKVLLAAAAAVLLFVTWQAWPATAAAPPDAAAARAPQPPVHTAPAATPVADAPRDATPAREPVPAAASATTDPSTAPDGERARVTGRLVAAPDGRPVRGATVTLTRSPASEAVERTITADDRRPLAQTSGDDGTFAFEVAVDPRWTWAVHAAADGLASMRSGLGPVATRERDLGVLTMLPMTAVAGRVVDSDGRAAAGVRVDFQWQQRDGRFHPESSMIGVVSDADGRFASRDRVPAGTWQVTARMHGLELPSRVVDLAAPGALPLAITVPAARELQFVSGVVRDGAGAPVGGAEVLVAHPGSRATATAADGTFCFARPAAAGPEEVEFAIQHHACEPWRGTAAWGDRAVRVTVQRLAVNALDLEVVRADTGEPVTDYRAMVFGDPLGGSSSGSRRPGEPGPHAGGRQRFVPMRAGRHIVRVFPGDAALAPSAFHSVDVQGGTALRVLVHPVATRRVVVERADGSPVAGSRVTWLTGIRDVPLRRDMRIVSDLGRLTSGSGMAPEQVARRSEAFPLQTATTDARGAVELRGGPKPRSALLVEGPDHLTTFVEPVTLDGEGPLRVVVATGGTVTGRVAPPAVARALGAGLWLIAVDDPLQQVPLASAAWLDDALPIAADGTFALAHVPPGRWRLHLAVHHSGLARLLPLVDLPPVVEGGTCAAGTVDVARFAPGTLRGRVLVDGAPWAGPVRLFPDWEVVKDLPRLNRNGGLTMLGPEVVTVAADATGAFELPLMAGEYTLQVSTGGDRLRSPLRAPGRIAITAGELRDVAFALRHIRLRVRIVDPDGRAVANRRCVVAGAVRSPSTDADGWLTIDPAPLEPFSLQVWPQASGRASPAAAGGAPVHPIELGPIAVPPTDDAEITLRLDTR